MARPVIEQPAWVPENSARLRMVVSVDPRPDTVEEVLNVCPHQASSFGGRHLRLAWVDSPPDPTQGWPGRRGPARVRVDTALRAQDPAVLITPGPSAGARDPVVDLLACAIPPHFVQPWATVEVVRDSGSDDAGDSAEEGLPVVAMGGRRKKGPPPTVMPGGAGGGRGGEATLTALLQRPESVLELLRGCVVRTGGVIHLLPAPTDAVCRGIRLLCRRAPEFVVPPLLTSAPETSAVSRRCGGVVAVGGHRSIETDSSSGRHREPGRRHSGRGKRDAGSEREAEVGWRGGAAGRGTTSAHGETERDRPTGTARAEEVGTDVRHAPHAPATATSKDRVGGGARGQSGGGGGGGDWASRLSEWGVVTTCSEVVTPHKALEVWYHDVTATATATSATATTATTTGREGRPRVEPDWVETVLRSHEPSVVDDLTAALELAEGPLLVTDGVGFAEEFTDSEGGGEKRTVCSADSGAAGYGVLLVHGAPGVGKTSLVEALAARLGCRLVKVSPGRLAAAAGVQADRVLMKTFRYCRRCLSHRVLLLIDSIDRLTPAAEGNVGASRGEVDAGVLNAFVLAVEQSRRDPRWRGRVAVVGVTSWPDQVHPTARRCAGQEILVSPPSQPLRAEILRRALVPPGQETSGTQGEILRVLLGDAQHAFEEVVGLCQGFTAGDMCAVAAAAEAALELSAAGAAAAESQPPGREWRSGARDTLSPGEALRAGFRQVRQRVAAGRGGAAGGGGGGGSSPSISGVPCVRWSEVGGLERAKRAVQEMVVWPARFPEVFSRMGITPASGVLLFGPPGTGKTLLAKAAATETGATFIELKISDVVRGEIGESEKAVARAFRTARELAPSIIFIDEFQALFASRDAGGGTGSRLASQLLVCMDELARWRAAGLRVAGTSTGERNRKGVDTDTDNDNDAAAAAAAAVGEDGRASPSTSPSPSPSLSPSLSTESGSVTQSVISSSNVMVLAATNAPEAVDTSFLRPGRFDEIVYAGLPDAEGRKHILRAAKDRMEGLRATKGGPTGGATTAAAVPENAVKEQTVHPDGGSIGRSGGGRGRTRIGGGRWANDVDLTWLSQETKGYSGADLSSLVRNAAMIALREEGEGRKGGGGRPVGIRDSVNVASANVSAAGRDDVCTNGVLVLARRHFDTALASTEPSSGPEAVAKHERWARQWHVA